MGVTRARAPFYGHRVERRLLHVLALLVVAAIVLSATQSSSATSILLLGDQTVEPKADSNPAGAAEAFQTTATTTGTVATLTVYVDSSSTSTSAIAGLYTDNAGHPGALLGQGTLTSPTRGAWNVIAMPAVSVTAGAKYWIALLGPAGSGTLAFRDRCCGNGAPSETASQTGFAALPATWPTGKSYKDGPVSVYGSSADSPVLVVSPPSMSFTASTGGPNPASQTFGISNGGGGSLDWTATTGAPWLSLSPATGSGASTVTVNASTGALAAGTYSDSITVTAPGAQASPQTIAVNVTVTTPDNDPPTAPTNLAASASGSTASLSWTGSTDNAGVKQYDVYRSTTDGFTPSTSNRVGTSPTASYSDTGLAVGTYYYRVAAEDAAGNLSAPSNQASAAITSLPTPVYLAGDQTIEANADSNVAGVAEAFKTTAAASGTVAKLTVWVDTGSTATTLAAGLYADSGGHPGALLTQSSLNGPTTGAWNDVAVPAAQVTSGTTYWIALLGPSSAGTLRFRSHGATGGTAGETSSQANLMTLPSTWTTGSPNRDGPFSAWAAGAGPTGPPPDQVGQWSAPAAWPIVAVHMSLLPNGNVLAFDAWNDAPNSQRVWNPTTGAFAAIPDPTNLFCAGHVLLPDGRTLIVGGNVSADKGIQDATLFNSSTNTWSKAAPMSVTRWYPTATVLGDGRVFVFAGDDIVDFSLPYSPHYFKEASQSSLPEVYNPSTNRWQDLTGAKLNTPLYPYMFQLSNGRILDAGPDITTRVIDPSTWTWSTVGTSPFDGASAVMYLPDKIMKAGAYANPDYYGSSTYDATAQTAVLDMTQSSPSWQSTAPMNYPRSYQNMTLLPDGTVLASGGESASDGTDLSKAVLPAELWDPSTKTWRVVASLTTGREYHSTALLLPDGRVLMAGGGQLPGRATNIYNGEIFSPPYLFKGNRPTISSVPSTIQYGSNFTVSTQDASSIQKVALVRTPSVTHAFDENQRYIPLNFTQGSGQLTVQAPANGNTAPPGYYMLFVLNGNGVPSVASFVRFPAPYEDVQAPSVPANLTASGSTASVSLSWSPSNDNVGVTAYDVYRSTTSGFTPSSSNKVSQTASTTFTDTGLAPGTYYYRVKAEDAAGNLSGASNEANATVTSGDTTPPSVSITAPAGGATVSATVPVNATASDNTGVAGVQFRLDGNTLGAEDVTAPYGVNWDTTTAVNGSHTLTAVARDAAGNTATSAPVTVTVSNTAPPPTTYLFGDQTIESTVDFNAAGLAEAFKTSSPNSGTLRKVTTYVDAGSTVTSIVVGVYSDSGGHPGMLLASGALNAPKAVAWNDVTMSSAAPVTSGTPYWIAVLSPTGGGQVKFRDRSGGNSETSLQTTLAALPPTWATGHVYGDGPMSAWAGGTIP
jgi:hypothetical protein